MKKRVKELIGRIADAQTHDRKTSHTHQAASSNYSHGADSSSGDTPAEALATAQDGGSCPRGLRGWRVSNITYTKSGMFGRPKATGATCTIGVKVIEFTAGGHSLRASITADGSIDGKAATFEAPHGKISFWYILEEPGSGQPGWELRKYDLTARTYLEALIPALERSLRMG